ncbi:MULTISPECIES: aldehyde dehydrogenase family protein [unclassified Streptomyces]|uniref:aldehyde dehydrogenase family protein n=1 Tax=unclassified Streptomyces TaxID=2593676 RepID=UPI0036FF8DBA
MILPGSTEEKLSVSAPRRAGTVASAHRPHAGGPTPTRAVSAAAAAARQWASLETLRAQALSTVASALETARAELIAIAAAETRVARPQLERELTRTTLHLSLHANQILSGGRVDGPVGTQQEHQPTAEGPVLVFASDEVPFAFGVAGAHTASAWAAGCPVVAVAHPSHPRLSRRTAQVVARALETAGAPEGAFALVENRAQGREMLRHPAFRAAAFTGSTVETKALARVAAEGLGPRVVHGELGSVDATVVTPAEAETRVWEVAENFSASLSRGVGRYSADPSLVCVPARHRIVYEIAWRVRTLPPARGLDAATAQGFLGEATELARRTGALRLLWSPDVTPLAPRLLVLHGAKLTSSLSRMAREAFGPLGLVVLYERWEDVKEMVPDLPDLTTGLYAQPCRSR